MSTDMVVRDGNAELLAVEQMTAERKALIKKTVAPDATPQELDLFIYDCLRRGTHPLDRMIHFTKRGGRYTPITGIDYMRSLAGETGEHAGTDDAVFDNPAGGAIPLSASVTVYRITQGSRYGYTATARWAEYYPGDGAPGFMWRKMPHVMLSKVAEALALRKAFPRQLGGMYEKAEMDQAAPKGEAVEVWQCLKCKSTEKPETEDFSEPRLCAKCAGAVVHGAASEGRATTSDTSAGAAPAAVAAASPVPKEEAGRTVAVERSGEPAPSGPARKPSLNTARGRVFALLQKYGIDISNKPSAKIERHAVYGRAMGLDRMATEDEVKRYTVADLERVASYMIATFEPPVSDGEMPPPTMTGEGIEE